MQQIGHIGGVGKRKDVFERTPDLYNTQGQKMDPEELSKGVGNALFERRDDWSSCAYFYLDHPENNLRSLPSASERTKGLFNAKDSQKRLDV